MSHARDHQPTQRRRSLLSLGRTLYSYMYEVRASSRGRACPVLLSALDVEVSESVRAADALHVPRAEQRRPPVLAQLPLPPPAGGKKGSPHTLETSAISRAARASHGRAIAWLAEAAEPVHRHVAATSRRWYGRLVRGSRPTASVRQS